MKLQRKEESQHIETRESVFYLKDPFTFTVVFTFMAHKENFNICMTSGMKGQSSRGDQPGSSATPEAERISISVFLKPVVL